MFDYHMIGFFQKKLGMPVKVSQYAPVYTDEECFQYTYDHIMSVWVNDTNCIERDL